MHGKFEYVSGETMEKAAEVILEIVKLFEQKQVEIFNEKFIIRV